MECKRADGRHAEPRGPQFTRRNDAARRWGRTPVIRQVDNPQGTLDTRMHVCAAPDVRRGRSDYLREVVT